uniref:Uncharacterized protein n=1 Tax=Mustela putorius furo TaxID=9669 RepID=M3Y633_MUSPF
MVLAPGSRLFPLCQTVPGTDTCLRLCLSVLSLPTALPARPTGSGTLHRALRSSRISIPIPSPGSHAHHSGPYGTCLTETTEASGPQKPLLSGPVLADVSSCTPPWDAAHTREEVGMCVLSPLASIGTINGERLNDNVSFSKKL